MPVTHPFLRPLRRLPSLRAPFWIAAAVLTPGMPIFAQSNACPVITPGGSTPAETAYAAARYSQAEDLYGQALAKNPHDLKLSAALVKTWLHEGQVSQAAAQVNR